MSKTAQPEQLAVLIHRYQTSKDPETRAEVRKQLASVGINVTSSRSIKENEVARAKAEDEAKKGRDRFVKVFCTVILILAIPLFFSRGKPWAEAADTATEQPETVQPTKQESPFDLDLRQRVTNLKSELIDLEKEVEQLQEQKNKLESMCEKVSDRMWNLAMISQENWTRQNAGRRDMVYMNKDWLPDRELTGIEKEGLEKMNEKRREATKKKEEAALLRDEENVQP